MSQDWTVQVPTWTANNRYPGIFRTVQARIAERHGPGLGGARLRILSFGCSSGSEISTLRAYFPDALLFGCDVNDSALHEAAAALLLDEATLFHSTPAAIAAHGPYDAVFAMSVLCRFPDSMDAGLADMTALYRQRDFAATVALLAAQLGPGGLLVLYNTSYAFRDLALARQFGTLHSALIGDGGFVDRFAADGRRVTFCVPIGPHYAHRLVAGASTDFTACVFEKGAAGNRDIPLPLAAAVAPPDTPPELMRAGPDLLRCAADGLSAAALGCWFVADGLVRAWLRSTPDGRIRRGAGWLVPADDAARDALGTDWRAALPPLPPPGRVKRAARAMAWRLHDYLRR